MGTRSRTCHGGWGWVHGVTAIMHMYIYIYIYIYIYNIYTCQTHLPLPHCTQPIHPPDLVPTSSLTSPLYTAHNTSFLTTFQGFVFNLKMAVVKSQTCSCTLGRNVNTSLTSNKISCVRQEHTLYFNYFIEHNGDDEPYDYTSTFVTINT